MSTKDFLLPDLGEGLTEGEVVAWLVAVGDVVEVDQPVAEIETAKAVVEVPSPFAGTITTLHAEAGGEVLVGSPLITIDIGGEGATAPVDDADAQPGDTTPQVASEFVPDVPDEEDEGSGSVLVGYGTTGGKGSRRRRIGGASPAPAPAPEPTAPEPVARNGRPMASVPAGRPMAKPPVRKLAKDAGIDLAAVAGTGPDGIITRADVQALIDAPAASPEPAPAAATAPAAPAPEPAPTPVAVAAGHGQTRVPLNQMRKAISAQMTRSRREIPEAVTWVEADATPLWELRQQLNAKGEGKISALAIIMRMVVAGLRRFPTINASLDTASQEMVLHRGVNLGFAAQTDRGLVVPVIHGAHEMGITELAAALSDLADTARAGKLAPEQMAGGTFTISNYGAFGVDGGDMVINHPEAAILGTGRIVDKPWVVDGELAVRKVTTYSLAFDHRLIDGGEAAGFLRFLADCTEDPAVLLGSL